MWRCHINRGIYVSPREFSIVPRYPSGVLTIRRIGRLVIYYPHAIDIYDTYCIRRTWYGRVVCVTQHNEPHCQSQVCLQLSTREHEQVARERLAVLGAGRVQLVPDQPPPACARGRLDYILLRVREAARAQEPPALRRLLKGQG